MPIAYPASPVVNQAYVYNGITWIYDGSRWVKQLSSLPNQSGKNGQFLTTNGTSLSWSADKSIPSQTGNSGRYLTTDGTTALWSTQTLVVNGGALGTPASGNLANCTFPTLNQNTTGTAAGLSTTLGVGSGGTGVTTSTGTGSVVLSSTPTLATPILTNPTVTNYVETLFTNTAGTTVTINLANGTVQAFTISGGNATVTMPAAVAGKSFILILTQDSNARSVTWTTVVWPSATAPTISTGSGKRDIYSFFSDGTNWYGATIGQNY